MSTKLQNLFHQIHFAPQGNVPSFLDFEQAHQTPAPISIRINSKKHTDINTNLKPVPWCPQGYYLPQRPVFTLDPLLHAGAYYVQEAGSMLSGFVFDQLFPNKEHLTVLDLCAAPGGKSTHIADLIGESSLLISNEVIQSRTQILAENASKWGSMNQWITQCDPKILGQIHSFFDCILIDAPCTGSGLWRRDVKTMEEWSIDAVKLCSERQKRIIADIAPSIKPQGYIIYSTCSYSREENEDMVDWMCTQLGWEAQEIKVLDKWNIERSRSQLGKPGYRFAPWHSASEGFFIAVLQAPEQHQKSIKNKKNASSLSSNKNAQALLQNWININAHFIMKNENWYGIPKILEDKYNTLLQHQIVLKKTGVAMGKILKNELLPDEELALCIHLQNQFPSCNVNKEEAVQFLRKEELKIEMKEKGWHLISYKGLGLGWGKWIGNRMNNYYPKSWRIRMQSNDASTIT